MRNFHSVSNSWGITGETTFLPLLSRRASYDGIKKKMPKFISLKFFKDQGKRQEN